MDAKVAVAGCTEGCAWASHMRGGSPIYVKICMLCKRIDWDDIADQVARVRAAVAEEHRELIKLLWAFYDTWMNKVDTYDPGGMPGIGSLLGTEGAFEMESAADAVEPHEDRIRALLADAEPSVGSPTPEVGTPTGGWEIQGFIENYGDAGRAGWSTVRRSPAEVAAFLSEALIDDAPREVILIRRGPQVEAADGGIGPWRLVSADRPACTCCGRRVAPLAQGVCGHCLNRCGAGGCSLRPADPSLPETQEGGGGG